MASEDIFADGDAFARATQYARDGKGPGGRPSVLEALMEASKYFEASLRYVGAFQDYERASSEKGTPLPVVRHVLADRRWTALQRAVLQRAFQAIAIRNAFSHDIGFAAPESDICAAIEYFLDASEVVLFGEVRRATVGQHPPIPRDAAVDALLARSFPHLLKCTTARDALRALGAMGPIEFAIASDEYAREMRSSLGSAFHHAFHTVRTGEDLANAGAIHDREMFLLWSALIAPHEDAFFFVDLCQSLAYVELDATPSPPDSTTEAVPLFDTSDATVLVRILRSLIVKQELSATQARAYRSLVLRSANERAKVPLTTLEEFARVSGLRETTMQKAGEVDAYVTTGHCAEIAASMLYWRALRASLTRFAK